MQERTCKGCGKTKPIDDFQKTGKLYKDGSPKYHGKCKVCLNDYHRKHYSDSPSYKESHKRSSANWQAKNKEKRNEYYREYRKSNKDKMSEYQRRWRAKVVKKVSAYSVEYKRNRKATDIEYLKTVREYCRIRRVRRTGAGGAHTLAEWEALKAQHNCTCLCCQKQEPEIKLTVDHVLPLVMGGTDDISNIQPLCFSCNTKKNAKHIDYR